MAKRGVLGGYLDTIVYESSLLSEKRGEDLIASRTTRTSTRRRCWPAPLSGGVCEVVRCW